MYTGCLRTNDIIVSEIGLLFWCWDMRQKDKELSCISRRGSHYCDGKEPKIVHMKIFELSELQTHTK